MHIYSSSDLAKEKEIIEVFSSVIGLSSHILKEYPDLLFPQLYNRLQWRQKEHRLKEKLDQGKTDFVAPWFRLLNKHTESPELIRTFTGHEGGVNKCRFSFDGKSIVSGDEFGYLKIWDAETGREAASIKSHSDRVMACCFSPDGNAVLSAGKDGMVNLWDLSRPEMTRALYEHKNALKACAFGPEGKSVLLAEIGIKLVHLDTGSMTELSSSVHPVVDCVINSNGRLALYATKDHIKTVDMISLSEREYSVRHAEEITCCAISPDNRLICVGTADKTLTLVDLGTGKERGLLAGHEGEILSCSFNPGGDEIVSTSIDGTLKFWSVVNGKELVTFYGHTGRVEDGSFSSDGKTVVSAGGFMDETLKLWAREKDLSVKTRPGHRRAAYACAFHPDGGKIATISWDETIKIWDSDNLRNPLIIGYHSYMGRGCVFSPDGNRLLTGGADGNLSLWNVDNGDRIRTFMGNAGAILNCAFSPNGDRIAAVSFGGALKIWDVKNGDEISSIEVPIVGWDSTCAFSPSGEYLISTQGFGEIAIRSADGKEVAIIQGQGGEMLDCAISRDGRWIASVTKGGMIELWDFRDRQMVKTVGRHVGRHFNPRSCAFTADRENIVTAGYDDKALLMWDIETGDILASFRGFSGRISDFDLNREGDRIVLVDELGQVLLLSIENMRPRPAQPR